MLVVCTADISIKELTMILKINIFKTLYHEFAKQSFEPIRFFFFLS